MMWNMGWKIKNKKCIIYNVEVIHFKYNMRKLLPTQKVINFHSFHKYNIAHNKKRAKEMMSEEREEPTANNKNNWIITKKILFNLLLISFKKRLLFSFHSSLFFAEREEEEREEKIQKKSCKRAIGACYMGINNH